MYSICLVKKMDSHESVWEKIWQKFDVILSSVMFSKPESCYSTVCYVSQLGSYVQLWALHFKRTVGKWRCNQNSKRCENHIMCGGRKTESNSQEHQKAKQGPVGMLQGETFDSVQAGGFWSCPQMEWMDLSIKSYLFRHLSRSQMPMHHGNSWEYFITLKIML